MSRICIHIFIFNPGLFCDIIAPSKEMEVDSFVRKKKDRKGRAAQEHDPHYRPDRLCSSVADSRIALLCPRIMTSCRFPAAFLLSLALQPPHLFLSLLLQPVLQFHHTDQITGRGISIENQATVLQPSGHPSVQRFPGHRRNLVCLHVQRENTEPEERIQQCRHRAHSLWNSPGAGHVTVHGNLRICDL